MIDENKLIEDIKSLSKKLYGCDVTNEENLISFKESEHNPSLIYSVEGIEDVLEMIKAQPKVNQWIYFNSRKTTEDEKETYGWDYILDCEIPDDGQKILVTDGEDVWLDIFLNDDFCSLDSGCDLIGLGWMPLPKTYKKGVKE